MRKLVKTFFLTILFFSITVGIVACPSPADAAVTSFKDVPTNLDHHEAIVNLAERGIVQGYKDGTFRPDETLTRAHASKILALSLNLETTNVKDPGFKDVNKNQWYYGYVAALANAGYISGFEDGTFRPNAPMTRAQAAKIIDLSYTLPLEAKADNPFKDVSNSAWYVDHIRTLVENNVTKGKTATTFEPKSNVTRAQMASFVVRAENLHKIAMIAEETKAKIHAIVLENTAIEKDGKKLSHASYYPKTDTLTITAYNLEEGIKSVQGLSFFSDKLLALGVSHIRIEDGALINVVENRTAAKQQLQNAMVDFLKAPSDTTDGDLVANDIKVTLFGQTEGIKFWEYFNVNLRVFTGY
ncbi:S-layer homology domain-containing protein [Sporosarcina sp. ACRSL]|uniref:S-layer homology domain-containing protein n=1 Tax=Sporosarcina sp. ACRSL TaxID=2918215 RepID=UPI001EF6CBB6|nr:S-layer homology domain-containing protein [Sporosarcina sp. ACRSL]MCG7344093.1 S-layer homology domain-containing protein [Sporosarcina sp. ACRSL]